jgi:glycosyltransferase involved in cell wall biosynthesis
MRVAFLANSFHLKMTRSSDFFIDFLRKAFDDVHVIPLSEAWAEIPRHKWDLLVVWMAIVKPEELEAFGIPRVVLVPMYDYCPHIREFWDKYRKFRVVCLSTTLLRELQSWGLDTFGAQFYPQSTIEQSNVTDSALRGFFWPRTHQLGWSTIKKLIGKAHFDSIHLHWTRDLNPDLTDLPTPEDLKTYSINTSSWFLSSREYEEVLRQANVFFASRRMEGLGMSFLEAMASGLCVVAPNAPVMNEYIQHGVNGLLYDPDSPLPLDFSSHAALGRAAFKNCAIGRGDWESALDALKDFLEAAPMRVTFRQYPLIRLKRRSYVALRRVYREIKGVIHGK